jgi:hypothetical protein
LLRIFFAIALFIVFLECQQIDIKLILIKSL